MYSLMKSSLDLSLESSTEVFGIYYARKCSMHTQLGNFVQIPDVPNSQNTKILLSITQDFLAYQIFVLDNLIKISDIRTRFSTAVPDFLLLTGHTGFPRAVLILL